MSQTKNGALKAKLSIIERLGGEEQYKAWVQEIGRKGGSIKGPKGFALNRELAIEAGRKGGTISRRTKKTV